MSSFVMNPSKKLTDLLGTYLEFDPEELKLGIWSGDLSMKNVSLKTDAVNPLLSVLSEEQAEEERPPLQIQLLQSEIGHFRFQIPWKRLVWGGGDVRLLLSDVTIVIGLKSRTNCEDAIRTAEEEETTPTIVAPAVDADEANRTREEKQEQLREAERRMLQGFSIGPALEKKAQPVKEEVGEGAVADSEKSAGRLEQWLSSITNSFLWRFFAGLQASIRNVRIVVVQDGVEIGTIIHSIDCGAHNKGEFQDLDKRGSSVETGGSINTNSRESSIENDNAEIELDAGDRQVDKQVKIRGLGGFVRQVSSKQSNVPRELSFSTSVTAEDYILRPSEVDVFFSLFYPSRDSTAKRLSSSAALDDASTAETVETTASGKARRGKRDRSVASTPSHNDEEEPLDDDAASVECVDGQGVGDDDRPKKQGRKARRATIVSTAETSLDSQPLLWADAMSTAGSRASFRRQKVATINPRLETHLFFGDLRTVCSSRHYHLVHLFCAASARMKNGRPEKTILSEIGDGAAPVTRSITVETPVALTTTTVTSPTMSESSTSPLQKTVLQRCSTVPTPSTPSTPSTNVLRLQLLQPKIESERTRVVTNWWKYAYANVVWQIRQKRRLKDQFRPFVKFDWSKQRYLRKKYVDLYISVRLEQSAFHTRLAYRIDTQSGEEELLAMEDELPVEQVLLYRSIARALGVRGLNSMPENIMELHVEAEQRSALKSIWTKAKERLTHDLMEITATDHSVYRRFSSMSSGAMAVGGEFDQSGEYEDENEQYFLSPIQKRAKTARDRRDSTKASPPPTAEKKSNSPEYDRKEITPIHPRRYSSPSPIQEEVFPSGTSLGSSQVNVAGDVLPAMADEPEKIVAKKPSHGTVAFSHDVHDAKTIKTFKTARTANSKRSRGSETEPTVEISRVIRFSFSLKFKSIELKAYDDAFDLHAARQRFYPSEGVKPSEQSESDDVSDLSVISADQKYFNEQGTDGSNEEEVEGLAIEHILSSTDFMLLGMPHSILDVLVSDVCFLVSGSSGKSRHASLSVNQIEVTGADSCHLLSSELQASDASAHGTGEETNDKQHKAKSWETGSIDFPSFQNDKAIRAFMFELNDGQQRLQCDLSKVSATIEMRALMKLHIFVSTDIMYPRRVIPFSETEMVRTYMLERIAGPALKPAGGGPDIAFRIHGFEIVLPMLQKVEGVDSDSRRSWREDDDSSTTSPAIEAPRVSASVRLVEYCSGSLVGDLFSSAHDEARTQAYFSAVGSTAPTIQGRKEADEDVRQLQMLDIEEILSRMQSYSFQHSVISLSGIDFSVYGAPNSGLKLVGNGNLLEAPIDAEILLSWPHYPELDFDCPRQQMVVQVSPLLCLLSEARLEALSACILSVSSAANPTKERSKSKTDKTPTSLPPRVEALSSHVLQSIDTTFARIKLSLLSDTLEDDCKVFSLPVKEIILEESMTDYLSLLSCFDLKYPVEAASSSARQIFMDRLSILGLTGQERSDCAETARLNFLEDFEMMQRSQTQVLLELSGGEETFGSAVQLSSESDAIDDVDIDLMKGEDASDEDSEESLDIIDTTIRNAVEKTMRIFLPLIEESHEEADQSRELLVVELEDGASFSAVNLFYDSHLSFHASSIIARNGAGIHLVRVGTRNSVSRGTWVGNEMIPEDDSMQIAESTDSNAVEQEMVTGVGITFTRFDLDKGYEFGAGGLPLTALGSDEGSDKYDTERRRERLDDFVIGECNLLFSAKVLREVITTVVNLSDASFRHQVVVQNEAMAQSDNSKSNDTPSSFFVNASTLSLLVASDELMPFSRVSLQDIAIGNKNKISARPKILASAKSFSVLNLTPEGQTYPEVISPLPDEAGPSSAKEVFSVELLQSPDTRKDYTELSVTLSFVRVFVVRQHINELMQFFLSKQHGIGLLASSFSDRKDPVIDDIENPLHPLHYKLVLQNSSVIVPRSSTSSELLAMEVSSLTVFNSYQLESWSLPTECAPLVRKQQVWPRTSSAASAPTDALFLSARSKSSEHGLAASTSERTTSSDTEFQDCFDRIGDTSVSTGTGSQFGEPDSLFDKAWISRITVQGQGLRLFTAIATERTFADIGNPRFNFFHSIAGRVAPEEPVYAPRPNDSVTKGETFLDGKAIAEKRSRKWEEISTNPVSFEIVADYAPHLRLLFADSISDNETDKTSPFQLDMRMSQFYLLLSVWYGNMQELPVMFPFSDAQIEEGARSKHVPPDFPEYGTDLFIKWLKDVSAVSSETACIFNELVLRCSFDTQGYFSQDPKTLSMMSPKPTSGAQKPEALRITMKDCVTSIVNDRYGILRLGCGASVFEINDERKAREFTEFLSAQNQRPSEEGVETEKYVDSMGSWADLSWGLDCDGHTFSKGLPQPFQLSTFLTPDWCLVNLGVEGAKAVMFDFTPIWIALDYFACYFSCVAYGNPIFEATERKEKLKSLRKESSGRAAPANDAEREPEGLNMDVRLWLLHPRLCVPSSEIDTTSACVRVESNSGFWFHYKTLGPFSSQEMGSTNLSVAVADEFQPPKIFKRLQGISASDLAVKTLVDGLSFGMRYDFNSQSNHKNVSVKIPFMSSDSREASHTCGITSPDIEVKPIILPPPKVCTPIVLPTRFLSSSLVCEIMMILEVLPVASKLLQNLAMGPGNDNGAIEETDVLNNNDAEEPTFSVNGEIGSVRLFVSDPVLGMHLPVAVVSVSSIAFTTSKLAATGELLPSAPREAPMEDLQVVVETHLWADYFKLGITRSWEPLLEPYQCMLLYEKSRTRGQGMSLNSDSAVHLNITGALLVTLDETINTLQRSISETFGDPTLLDKTEKQNVRARRSSSLRSENEVTDVEEASVVKGRHFEVFHQIPKQLKSGERVAFSFLNLTGQRIRIHQKTETDASGSPTTLTYLDHVESTKLAFKATMSVFRNLDVVEVPFPGLPHSSTDHQTSSIAHTVDVQIPGFRWLQGLSVDTSGRQFDDLVPRSKDVLLKVRQDWRLENALKLLTEVGLENGGRLITVRSPFEIRNNTSHSIALTCNPDPRHHPVAWKPVSSGEASSQHDFDERTFESLEESVSQLTPENHFEQIEPGEAYQVPTLLLEAALQLSGNHLGCLWIRPEGDDSLFDSLVVGDDVSRSKPVASYSSRPIQLSKIVHESSVIFSSCNGEDLPSDRVRSGVQVSCPVSEVEEGISFAPFCYVVEIRRSPLVVRRDRERTEQNKGYSPEDVAKENLPEKKARIRDAGSLTSLVHGPVSYSLLIHPPLIIENLLPEGGRFELMHASRRSVLWFADLKPGERVPVHSVGLDAPLLLLINLGFCRTPVGEGALVHHGHGKGRGFGLGSQQRVGLKTIGKAVTKGTKQVGKTITDIIDSPDKRGQGKLFMVQNPQFHRSKHRTQIKKRKDIADSGALGLDTGMGSRDAARGKVHRVESQVYSPADVASETTVVDSVGQRLSLRIENVRGGGGQRRISLFCPFWIVNTTEHSLRYKQEKGTSFVSGTVLSSSQDGSKPVDGSNRNYAIQHKKASSFRSLKASSSIRTFVDRGTIFAGTPGALATSHGRCTLSPSTLATLLDKDLPLDKLSRMAFMFNFHEDALSIGHQRLCMQLGDADSSRYTSGWSNGFSLDSVGVTQIVGLSCREGRALELSVTISVAPDILSGYTKIVRVSPRYVLVNQLEMPIRIFQDSSLFYTRYGDVTFSTDSKEKGRVSRKWYISKGNDRPDKVNQYESLFGRPVVLDDGSLTEHPVGTTADPSALYIATAGHSELVPFHLADTRSERQLRIDLGYPWNLTASFSSDITGEYTLKPTRAVDLRLIRHVSTRAAPQYRVMLPPPDENEEQGLWDGELGVWFETDWGGDERVIVKGTKRGRYSFNHTDIHVGDELLLIDGTAVSEMSFADAMRLLKERIAFVAARQMSVRRNTEMTRRARRRSTRILRSMDSADALDADSFERVVLTFRTVEERLRRLRVKASKSDEFDILDGSVATDLPVKMSDRAKLGQNGLTNRQDSLVVSNTTSDSAPEMHIEMRTLHNSIFVFVRPQDLEKPPFRIENRAINHVIHFRQRGCDWHAWNSLKPGESRSYTWEEPMRPKKLAVRVGRNSALLLRGEKASEESRSSTGSAHEDERDTQVVKHRQFLSFQQVDSEEFSGFGATKIVKLEEIGFTDFLPCPGAKSGGGNLFLSDDHLHCQVDTDGGTRVLVISDSSTLNALGEAEHTVIERHLETLQEEVDEQEEKLDSLRRLKFLLALSRESSAVANAPTVGSGDLEEEGSISDVAIRGGNATVNSSIESKARDISEVLEDNSITRCNQIVVQVLEATGLNTADFSGLCNPYCEVVFKERSKKRRFLRKDTVTRSTYYVEKSDAPTWVDQTFIFDVPQEAVEVTRGHAIRIRVRNFRVIGYHPDLGQTSVHLRSLRNQHELVGWYPLVGRSGRSELDESANWGRGSVKIRVQWIYTVSGLLDYFILISERRLQELQRSRDGMQEQMGSAIEADKRKKAVRDPFGIARIPNLLGSNLKTFVKAEDNEDTPRRSNAWKKLRKSLIISPDSGVNVGDGALLDVGWNKPYNRQLRASNAKYLWWLHSQTAESRRSRRLRSGTLNTETMDSLVGGNQITWEDLEEIQEAAELAEDSFSGSEKSPDIMVETRSKSSPHSYTVLNYEHVEAGTQSLRRARAASLWNEKDTENSGELLSVSRPRALSLSDLQAGDGSQELRPFVFRARGNGDRVLPSRILELPNDILVDVGSIEELAVADSKDEAHRLEMVESLFKQGVLYHHGGTHFHHRHLTHHFRESLLTSVNSLHEFRPKTPLRATLWMRDLKSWTAAQAVLNDKELTSLLSDTSAAGKDTGEHPSSPSTHAHYVDDESQEDIYLRRLQIPLFAPPTMVARSLSRAEDVFASRNQFEKACRRSLSSVLNPGGWLTVRPITALNLPDTYTGMSVKVRYGTEVLTSQTADAKVTPTWAFDDDVALTPRAGVGMGDALRRRLSPTKNEKSSSSDFKFDDNDLPIHVEPLQTSGTVRISVIGERLNYKAEIGVLHIPLGAAISCCIEAMDEFTEGRNSVAAPTSPRYIRWFPLMSPRDSTPVEGDLGLSYRPKESEKLRDSMFSQYFAPCIKLALIWQPDHPNPEVESISPESEFARSQESDFSHSHGRDERSETTIETERISVTVAPTPATHTYFNADIGRISAALIDSQRAIELLSFSLSDIDVRYSVTKAKTRMTLAIGWVQVDHQDKRAREPVVLSPTPVAHPQPTLQFIAVKDNLRSKSNVDSYNYIAVAAQEMDLTIEESWMFDLWEFFISVVRRREVTRKASGRSEAISRKPSAPSSILFEPHLLTEKIEGNAESRSLLEIVTQKESASPGGDSAEKRMYVEQLLLGSVKVNLTYLKGGRKGDWEVTERGGWAVRGDVKDAMSVLPESAFEANITIGGLAVGSSTRSTTDQSEIFLRWCEYTHDEELWSESQGSGNASHNLPNIIASAFPSVSDARIRLQGKLIEHVFESPGEILASIRNYYVNESLRQIYKIVGSLDFVGNPSMVLSSFVTGVRDFVVAPSKEFFRNPKKPSRVGIGCAKGTLSLVSHSASGLFGFASKVSATAGQLAAVLSFDEGYKKWHNDMIVAQAKSLDRRWKKRGVQKTSAMLTKPLEDIILGIMSGTSGVFVSPYKGAQKGGGAGFAKGVVVGGLGLVVKPVVGVLDAFAHFTGSIHDIAKSVNVLEKRYQPARRLRLPYIFGLKNVLLPFDTVAARSTIFLRRYPVRGRKPKSQPEIYVAAEVLQMEPGVATFVVATTFRVILIKVKRDGRGRLAPSLCWQVRLNTGASVSSSVQDEGHNGVALTITRRQRSTVGGGLTPPSKEDADVLPTTLDRDQSDFSVAGTVHDESHLGTRPSRVWESISDTDTQEAETADAHLFGSAQSRKGEILEWYRVLGEFQHRRQLTRMHNAVCCICGDLGSVIREKGLGPEESQEGRTSFGQMVFGDKLATSEDVRSSAKGGFYVALEEVPWLHWSLAKENLGAPGTDQEDSLVATRKNWLFSNEIEESAQEGGPEWLVHARARTMFVAPAPPPLPAHLDPRDEVVTDIIDQMKQGYISYNQCDALLASHAEAVASEDNSEASVSIDDVFISANMGFASNQEHDFFQSAKDAIGMSQLGTPTILPPGTYDDLEEENGAAFLSPLSIARSPKLPQDSNDALLATLDQEEKSEDGMIHKAGDDDTSESEGSIEDFESLIQHSPLTRKEKPLSSSPPPDRRTSENIMGARPPRWSPRADSEGLEFASAVADLPASHATPQRPVGDASEDAPLQSRLDRVEAMLEQLLVLNGNQAAVTARTGHVNTQRGTMEDTTAAALRRDIADLQNQIVEQRNFYQDALATAALRQEVADLRREAAGHRGAGLKDADTSTLREEVTEIRNQFEATKEPIEDDSTSAQVAVNQQPPTSTTPESSLKSSSSFRSANAGPNTRRKGSKRVMFAADQPMKQFSKIFHQGKPSA